MKGHLSPEFPFFRLCGLWVKGHLSLEFPFFRLWGLGVWGCSGFRILGLYLEDHVILK